MIVDKTGRKIKVGQMVDVMLFGMFQGKILAIKEKPFLISPQQQINPHIVIACTITPFVHPSGGVPDVYIIGEPDPKDPLVIESEKPRLIVS